MQCSWFANEHAYSSLRQRKYGHALRKFLEVQKVRSLKLFGQPLMHGAQFFEDFWDDQFDYHTYAIRKSTLRAYVRYMLRGHM